MKPKSTLRHFLCIASSALLAIPSAHAASGTWNGISGAWSDTTNPGGVWAGGIVANGADFTANFTGVDIIAAQIVNLSDIGRTIGNITFTDTTTSSHNLTISGANILTLDRTDVTQPTIDVTQAGRTLTISSEIAGNDGLLKSGVGLCALGGANSYTGTTTVSAGGLILTNLSGIATSSDISVAAGASLQLNVAGTYANTAPIFIIGVGLAGVTNTGAIFFADVGASLSTLNAPLILEGATLISSFGANVKQALGGAIEGTGPLTIESRGGNEKHFANWTLNAASSYSGDTTILNDNGLNDVTVKLGIADALPTTTSLNLQVLTGVPGNNFATLDLNGFDQTLAGLTDSNSVQNNAGAFIAGKRVINSSATLATLTINNSANVTYGQGTGKVVPGTIGGTTAGSFTGDPAVFVPGAAADNLNLTKTGSGTLILAGTNTYLDTTISEGTLQIGANGTTGSLGSGPVLNDAALSFTRSNKITVSNVISGTGTVTNSAPGTLEVTGNNTYSGGTFIDVGSLLLRTDLGGRLGSGAVTVASGAGNNYLIWAPSAVTLTNNIVLNGATGVANRPALNHDGGAGKVTLTGTVTLNATSDIGVGGSSFNDMEITGVISGVGGLIVDEKPTSGATRTLILSGANIYTGGTSVIGGTLQLGATNVIPDTGSLSIGEATLNAATAGTETAGALDVTAAATINLGLGAKLVFTNGGTATWAGSLDITGNFVSGSSLKFGSSNSGLTLAQLANITLNGAPGSFTLDGSGFLLNGGAPTGFAAWQAANSPAGGIDEDHDNDGVSNGIEFFLVGPADSTGFTALPAITPAGSTYSITWTKGSGYDGSYNTHFVVETSATLADPWTTETLGGNVTITGPNSEFVTYTFPAPLGSKRFARLIVTGP